MRKTLKAAIVILCVCSSVCYAAFKVPQAPQGYVSDYSGLLGANQKQALNTFLNNYELQTTNQIFVGIFDSLEGGSLEDISIRMAEQWKPGLKEKDNGVLLLIFIQDRKMRIEVGYGLEPVLTDLLANAIITNEIAPAFRKGDYYLGIKNAVYQMTSILSGEVSSRDLEFYKYRAQKAGPKKRNPIVSLILFIFFIFLFIRHPFLALMLFSGGFSSGGRSSGGFGGGFLGGGGGSFGGGGASGGW